MEATGWSCRKGSNFLLDDGHLRCISAHYKISLLHFQRNACPRQFNGAVVELNRPLAKMDIDWDALDNEIAEEEKAQAESELIKQRLWAALDEEHEDDLKAVKDSPCVDNVLEEEALRSTSETQRSPQRKKSSARFFSPRRKQRKDADHKLNSDDAKQVPLNKMKRRSALVKKSAGTSRPFSFSGLYPQRSSCVLSPSFDVPLGSQFHSESLSHTPEGGTLLKPHSSFEDTVASTQKPLEEHDEYSPEGSSARTQEKFSEAKLAKRKSLPLSFFHRSLSPKATRKVASDSPSPTSPSTSPPASPKNGKALSRKTKKKRGSRFLSCSSESGSLNTKPRSADTKTKRMSRVEIPEKMTELWEILEDEAKSKALKTRRWLRGSRSSQSLWSELSSSKEKHVVCTICHEKQLSSTINSSKSLQMQQRRVLWCNNFKHPSHVMAGDPSRISW